MIKRPKPPRARTVYVVGAGFSAGLGYPLTTNLLVEVWPRLDSDLRPRLGKVIQFHHPNFNPDRNTTFPYIETLLTEIAVNLDMFGASRQVEGAFSRDDLLEIQAELLTAIAHWFHGLYEVAQSSPWLGRVTSLIRKERATVISFNWDLILDHGLFDGPVGPAMYGVGSSKKQGPYLLKPHGSLNWYLGAQAQPIKDTKKVKIHNGKGTSTEVWAFLPPRDVKTSNQRLYTPFIVPPTFNKDFSHPISTELWRRCADVLSVAERIVILGYSLPEADLQAKFIFRCGFHNQTKGTIRDKRNRNKPTGPSQVTLISPDGGAAKRIEGIVGLSGSFNWKPMKVEEWAELL